MVKLAFPTQHKYLYSYLREGEDVHRALKTDNSLSLCLYCMVMVVFRQNGLEHESLERRQMPWKGTGGPVKGNPEGTNCSKSVFTKVLGSP